MPPLLPGPPAPLLHPPQGSSLVAGEGEPVSKCHTGDQQPAFFNLQYQQLLGMQAEQAQRELSFAPAGHGQPSNPVTAVGAGSSDQSTAWGGLLLPEELLACWPQPSLVKLEAEECGPASRSSSAQQWHSAVAPTATVYAQSSWTQRAAGEREASALAVAALEGAAGRVARVRTPPGRRRTRSISQQEAAAAVAAAAAHTAGGPSEMPVSPFELARQEDKGEEEGDSEGRLEEEEEEEEGGRLKRQRRRRTDSGPPSPTRQALRL